MRRSMLIILLILISTTLHSRSLGIYDKIILNIEKVSDVGITENYIAVTTKEGKIIVFDREGNELFIITESGKYESQIAIVDDVIFLKCNQNIKIYKNGEFIKNIVCEDLGIYGIYSIVAKSEEELLFFGMLRNKEKKGFIDNCLAELRWNDNDIKILQKFSTEKVTFNLVFKQNPIKQPFYNKELFPDKYFEYNSDSLTIFTLDGKKIKEIPISFPEERMSKRIKDYYDRQKVPMIKFNYDKKLPVVYKMYSLDKNVVLVDTWSEKKRRIEKPSNDKYFLFMWKYNGWEKAFLEINPDNIKLLNKNILCYSQKDKLIVCKIKIME